MRICICGGRDFTDAEYALSRFERLRQDTPITEEICGMAAGGDLLGKAWADMLGIPVREFPADWDQHGKRAGPLRNIQMLEEGKPDLVLALPGGKGTAHMVEISHAAGVPVVEYKYLYFSRKSGVGGFMSNFWPSELVDEKGILYKTSEHYYQAEKTLDPATREWIVNASDGADAKKRGNNKKVEMRSDWSEFKLVAMKAALDMKFAAGTELAQMLLDTGDDYLCEFAPWGDKFFGVNKDYKGLNWLGRLLMRRRDELLNHDSTI